MLITNRREGRVKEIDHNTAAQESAAKRVIDAQTALGLATPETAGRLQDLHDTHMADLVALHGGDQDAAEATLAGVGWAMSKGKR